MLDRQVLIEFYVNQYTYEGKRKSRLPNRVSGYEKRIWSLGKTLSKAGKSQVSKGLMDDYHRQLKNQVRVAFRRRNTTAINYIMSTIVPHMVRLDLTLLLPEEQALMDSDFVEYLRREKPGAICTVSLFELYQNYRRFSIQKRIIQLVPSRPEMEFPKALNMNRRFILHVGPTNSGKTYQALEHLKHARHGIYLGPLRLLALEVYEKMNECGTPCTMLTGQECIKEEGSVVTAATVEMADTDAEYDIAVIDEAQMVADPDRGHSWTRAILGLQAQEIHVCMSPAGAPAVKHLISLCGDHYELHHYERRTPLLCEAQSFIFPDDVQEGDALVVFSKRSVLDVAGRLEEQGISTSVIYGSLPPEIRRRQVQLFADGETKVVVATDAVGMGLNLPVRRIVFVQTEKFDGTSRRPLLVSEVKQIAGRAGRYGLHETGYVTAMGEVALAFIREKYEAEEEDIHTVSLGFPRVLLDLREPLDAILKVWHSVKTPPPFEKVSIEDTLFLYEQAYRYREKIYGFDNKHLLYKMISCPVDIKDPDVVTLWLHYCKTYTADVSLPHPSRRHCSAAGLAKYETYYKMLDLYYQFSSRMGKMIDAQWLEEERSFAERTIMRYLSKEKQYYISTCKFCGRLLPVGYRFGICERCHTREGYAARRYLYGSKPQGGTQ